jgi:hypothetical protein
MGRGLSSLQARILRALKDFPTYEQSVESDTVHLKDWAEPKHLFLALDIHPNPATRATLSKALERLVRRGLVAKFHGQVAIRGNAARYALITMSENAGAKSGGPTYKLSRSIPKRCPSSGAIDGELAATDE